MKALQKRLEINGGTRRSTSNPKEGQVLEEEQTVVDLREEIDEDSQLWNNHAIIARIIGLNWSRKNIKLWVAESWGNRVVIKFIPKGFFVVLFEDSTERERILNQEIWYADKHAVYLQPWKPNFNPIPLLVYSNPIWINMYNLPIEYWGESYLGKIGRTLGSVLEIDFDDEGELCKLIKIKVAAVKKIPEYICLQTSNGIWRQRLEIEKERRVCSRCGNKSHGIEDCRMFVRRAKKPIRNPEQLWRKKTEKTVRGSEAELNTENSERNKEKVGNSSAEIAEENLNAKIRPIEEIISQVGGEGSYKEVVMGSKDGGVAFSPHKTFNMNKGLSNTEFELDKEFVEDCDQEDALENVDPRCISQSANVLLGKGKGSRGRRSNCQKREESAKEKGIVSVFDFMRKARGEGISPGKI
ncbi:hypothetical protein SUGI_0591380 [Cryptomeria japonica]|nr:hypothetical protein SUGI_0591380 [Cryptomeria japonica]